MKMLCNSFLNVAFVYLASTSLLMAEAQIDLGKKEIDTEVVKKVCAVPSLDKSASKFELH